MSTIFLRHMSRISIFTYISVLFLAVCIPAQGQISAWEGYTLYNPNNSRTTYLINMKNEVVHTWQNARSGGYCAYLLENGNLLRPATVPNAQLQAPAYSGLIQEITWTGNVVWEFTYSSATYIAHHDIEPLPNGNILLIAYEVKSAAEAVAKGRTTNAALWPDHIVEVRPIRPSGGEIVWKWHAWDHLVQDRDPAKPNYGVISEHPGRLNVNLPSLGFGPSAADWLHVNGISYNPDRDEIVITSHNQSELWVIDHSTTTEEAAGNTGGRRGKGGDILYRWGRPANYGRSGSAVFDVVHCPWWVPKGLPGEGNILAFNNNARARASIITELTPPRDAQGNYVLESGAAFGPATPAWTYSNSTAFFSNHLGGNQRLPNGNTLISEATKGRFLEVTPSGEVVWSYNTGRETARVLRYAPDYPGLKALHTTSADGGETQIADFSIRNYPNPFSGHTVLTYTVAKAGPVRISIHDVTGREVARFDREANGPGTWEAAWDGTDTQGAKVPGGMYLCRLYSAAGMRTHKLVVMGE
ncbi:MAG: aryl-sulfate sulfotransferase [Bacteroidia bacterium]|nr:aryl-sulfate sulfotransferase [Bacteroidia bacterium]